MRYWDTSAIVPLLLEDTQSPRMTGLLKEDAVIITWWGTEVECVSAIARLEREEKLNHRSATTALQRLQELNSAWNEIQAGDLLRQTAKRLLRVHPLRAADALQLAAALVAAELNSASLEVVSLDQRLTNAAEREGFTVIS